MNLKLTFIILIVSCLFSNAQVIGIDIDTNTPKVKFETGNDVINFMHQKYKNGPCKSYTFSQKNIHYQNDSITGNSKWREYIEFPDKFRIDFGETTEGNFVIFKNDSSYNYKNHLLKKTKYNTNTLLLLLGGMYYRDLTDVISRLQAKNYNTKALSTQKFYKQQVYVIGAMLGDTSSNQIWVSKKNWRIVRIIEKMEDDSYMDMTFDSFQKNCNGFIETKVTFKRNGKIEQVEEYYDIKPVNAFDKEVFNPK